MNTGARSLLYATAPAIAASILILLVLEVANARTRMPPPSAKLLLACERQSDDIMRVTRLRDAGRFKEARSIIDTVVTRDPRSFRGHYIRANILFETAQADLAAQSLQEAISLFPQLSRECKEQTGWYSIFGYAGAEYYSLGKEAAAETYLLIGYKNRHYLFAGSEQALLNNLGLLSFKRGDLTASKGFYEKAVAAGSIKARTHLRAVKNLIDGGPSSVD